MEERHFLAKDLYGQWYCLPEWLRETWDRLFAKEDSHDFDAWTQMAKYKTDLNKLTFESPAQN